MMAPFGVKKRGRILKSPLLGGDRLSPMVA